MTSMRNSEKRILQIVQPYTSKVNATNVIQLSKAQLEPSRVYRKCIKHYFIILSLDLV